MNILTGKLIGTLRLEESFLLDDFESDCQLLEVKQPEFEILRKIVDAQLYKSIMKLRK
jgi:hypothetical protein